MRITTNLSFLTLMLCIGLLCACTTAPTYEQRLTELRARIDAVNAQLDQADGYAQQAGRIDTRIAGYFADYIEWELAHPEMTAEALASNDRYRGQHTLSPAEREARYHAHVD